MARESKPFRDRNPVTIGAISLSVIALLVFLAFNAQSLPLIGGGTVYKAQFSEAAGLQPDDVVRVAGVKVGKVESLSLEDGELVEDFLQLAPTKIDLITRTAINGSWFNFFMCSGDATVTLPATGLPGNEQETGVLSPTVASGAEGCS